MTPLTLKHLSSLCMKYVPRVAWHPAVRDNRRRVSFWPAHELGHLLTTERWRHREPYFGLDDDKMSYDRMIAYEVAAMSVSRRLLSTVGRPDLYAMEREYTDGDVLSWPRARANALLRKFRVRRLPTTLEGLVELLERRTRSPQ